MIKNQPNSDTSTKVFEYKRKGKFLNIKIDPSSLTVKKCQKFKKPLIEFYDPKDSSYSLLAIGWDKIGQLADFLGLKRNVMKVIVKANQDSSVIKLNELLRMQAGRVLQINASEFNGTMFIFAFSTKKHKIVTFTEIRNIINKHLGNLVKESQINGKIYWEKDFSSFETSQEQFDVKIRISSGKNTKESAIKVIVLIRVASCSNSVIAGNFTAIKRTKGWCERFIEDLDNAQEIAEKTKEIIEIGATKPISYEDGIEYIKNLDFGLKKEDKIKYLKKAIRDRFEFEYKRNKTKLALSQALSNVGTYFETQDASARSLEILQENAYLVFN